METYSIYSFVFEVIFFPLYLLLYLRWLHVVSCSNSSWEVFLFLISFVFYCKHSIE